MDGWTAIIMAAGKGARMHSSTPKVLHRVAGVPMIGHTTAAVQYLQPASTIVVVSPENEAAIADELGDTVAYAEQPKPLGTGHALAVALERVPLSSRNILLLNGDMPLISGNDIAALAADHVERHAAVTVGFVRLSPERAADLGTLERGARGKALAIVEAVERKPSKAASVDASVGVYAFDVAWVRGAIESLPEHAPGEQFVTDLVAMAVADGQRVETVAVDSVRESIGVNTRAQLAVAERAMQERLRERAMDAGVTLIDPATVYLHATVELAADVIIYPNTSISGASVIGVGAAIGPNAQLTDANVGAGATVGSAVIKSATVGENAHVGPYSLLREGTVLEPGAYVGAHTEIKASRIGGGSHVGHFSYVGDAIIGENVNIGAGVVTCNFDGVSKHVTEIGDGAFIGSGGMLVAPIKIGAGALTGAGAVVSRDVEPGGRVAGVPARALGTRRPDAEAGHEGGKSLG
jgi:bifunctional UDP-N-acetylglucosamine pyrophosphorylase/glucosamine-1-phosphate N-acetyltransferase